MTESSNKTLAEIVMADNHAAPILEKFKLDYCCKGKRTLERACTENNIPLPIVLQELEKMQDEYNHKTAMPFTEMSAQQLIDHILTHHHFFVRQAAPQIIMHLTKLVAKLGNHFQWISEGYNLFKALQEELLLHMRKEELILFPLIEQIEKHYEEGLTPIAVRNISALISLMEHDHEEAGKLIERLREITNDYTPQESACTTHRVTLAELKEFQENLHTHVHLENNILFPKALELEKQLNNERGWSN